MKTWLVVLWTLLSLPATSVAKKKKKHEAEKVPVRETWKDEEVEERVREHQENFQYSEEIRVIGPSVFPKPSDRAKRDVDDEVVVAIQPYLGAHHPEKDAIIAFASEYPLMNYVVFIGSLRDNGYDGDIVLSVSQRDVDKKEIEDFLKSDPGVVVYVPNTICFNAERETVQSIKGGSRVCSTHHLFGRNEANGTVTPLDDPRAPRTVANTRYEIYWTMVTKYNPHSWILVVDARDTVFQSDPFAEVPRSTDPTAKSGLLYFFGENMDATRIGSSKFNRKWVTNAYGEFDANSLGNKPTLCSGASMGEQVAMESYIRALVNEGDETGTVLTGSDQGFHNHLYYSHKLAGALQIHAIVVFDQGTGIVNNLGALREEPLENWGNGKIVETVQDGKSERYIVRNWNGVKSPVVHQYDRHKVLSNYFYKEYGAKLLKDWEERFEAPKLR